MRRTSSPCTTADPNPATANANPLCRVSQPNRISLASTKCFAARQVRTRCCPRRSQDGPGCGSPRPTAANPADSPVPNQLLGGARAAGSPARREAHKRRCSRRGARPSQTAGGGDKNPASRLTLAPARSRLRNLPQSARTGRPVASAVSHRQCKRSPSLHLLPWRPRSAAQGTAGQRRRPRQQHIVGADPAERQQQYWPAAKPVTQCPKGRGADKLHHRECG